jgi:hypothetical protein
VGSDEAALLRLWQAKRGELEPEDLSQNLIVQLGVATEDLNRRWFEANTGEELKDVQRWVRHPHERAKSELKALVPEDAGMGFAPSGLNPERSASTL